MTIQDYLSSTEEINLDAINFKFAFTVEGYYDKKRKHDPRYVKQRVQLTTKADGVLTSLLVPFHDCTEEDYAQFYPVNEQSRIPLKAVQERVGRGLYCVDKDIDLNVYGKSPGDYQFVEILFLPCNVIVDDDYGFKDSVSNECVDDLEAQ